MERKGRVLFKLYIFQARSWLLTQNVKQERIPGICESHLEMCIYIHNHQKDLISYNESAVHSKQLFVLMSREQKIAIVFCWQGSNILLLSVGLWYAGAAMQMAKAALHHFSAPWPTEVSN